MLPRSFPTFRDARLSVFQAAAAAVAHIRAPGSTPGLERAAGSVASMQASGAAVPVQAPSGIDPAAWLCARLGWQLLQSELWGDTAQRSRLEDELLGSRCDPLWAGTLVDYLGYFGPDGRRAAIPYIRPEVAGPAVIEIASDARVALLSDWGTGRPTARAVLQDLAQRQPDVLVHLGDIYYVGTAAECERNFRQPITAELRAGGRNPAVYTLSGNHDMYSGGEGYYGLIDHLNDGPARRGNAPATSACAARTGVGSSWPWTPVCMPTTRSNGIR